MNILTLFFTGFLFMTAPIVASAAGQSPADGSSLPSVTRLPNGLTVLVKEDNRFPLVSLRLYVHAGSAYETPDEAGISHMLEHMVFKGTEKRPKGQVATDIESTGGYLNAATSFDYTVYLTDMTKDSWKIGLDVLKDMAFFPTLDPDELESEKDVVVAELKRGEDNPGQRLFRMTQQAALRGTPYYNPIIGYEETVRGLTSEKIRNYISRLYQPQSMLLVVLGDAKTEDVIAEATRLFGERTNNQPVVPPSILDTSFLPKGFTAAIEEGPWNKVHLTMSFPAPAMRDLRAAQLDVLAQLLGGDATSRFYRTYKYEKRLVDSISVGNYSFERLGLIYIQATLDADKLVPFWEAFTQDLANLSDTTFSNEELERARLNLEDDLFRSRETLSGYASKLGYFAFFEDGVQGEANYLRAVRDTDQSILLELIKDTFTPEALSLVALLPEGTSLADSLPKGKESNASAWDGWFAQTLDGKWKDSGEKREERLTGGVAGKPEVIDLGKGRTVVLIPDGTLPYAAVNLVYTGGDTLLEDKTQGLAAFTASLLTKGTSTMSATAVQEYLSDRAASFAASSGRQTFSFSMNAPSRFIQDMFSLLQQTLIHPALKDEEAERVRENQISAITMREDQPLGLAFRKIFPFLFSHHPYGYLQLGEKASVAEFTAKEAENFWKNQRQQPWVLSVCGTFDRDAILAAAAELPQPVKKEITPPAPSWNKDKDMTLGLPGRNQGHLLMVFPTVGYGTADEPGLDLLQNILAGQSGLLFRDLRDKQGLGYTVTAIPWKTEKAGALIFYIGTDPGTIGQAEQGFHTVIADLHENLLPEAELNRGKKQMEGDYYREHQSLGSRSAEAATLTVLHRPLDAARQLVEKAQQVTPEDLRELARKYLNVEQAYIVKVLPEGGSEQNSMSGAGK